MSLYFGSWDFHGLLQSHPWSFMCGKCIRWRSALSDPSTSTGYQSISAATKTAYSSLNSDIIEGEGRSITC